MGITVLHDYFATEDEAKKDRSPSSASLRSSRPELQLESVPLETALATSPQRSIEEGSRAYSVPAA